MSSTMRSASTDAGVERDEQHGMQRMLVRDAMERFPEMDVKGHHDAWVSKNTSTESEMCCWASRSVGGRSCRAGSEEAEHEGKCRRC